MEPLKWVEGGFQCVQEHWEIHIQFIRWFMPLDYAYAIAHVYNFHLNSVASKTTESEQVNQILSRLPTHVGVITVIWCSKSYYGIFGRNEIYSVKFGPNLLCSRVCLTHGPWIKNYLDQQNAILNKSLRQGFSTFCPTAGQTRESFLLLLKLRKLCPPQVPLNSTRQQRTWIGCTPWVYGPMFTESDLTRSALPQYSCGSDHLF